MPHKAPYVPQIGDDIVYFRQGHELYVQAVKRNRIYDIYMRSQPWRKLNLRVKYFCVYHYPLYIYLHFFYWNVYAFFPFIYLYTYYFRKSIEFIKLV